MNPLRESILLLFETLNWKEVDALPDSVVKAMRNALEDTCTNCGIKLEDEVGQPGDGLCSACR